MATITDSGAVTASTLDQATYASASFAPAVSDLLVVLVVASTTVDAGDVTVSANGVTAMTRVDRSTSSTSTHSQYIFVANQLTTGTAAMTVTFDCTGDNATGAIVMVARVSGMTKTGATAIKQSIKVDNGAGATTPTFAFPGACLTSNPTLVVLGQVATAGSLPPTGWTEAVDTSYGTPTIGGTYVFRDSGFTGTTITWGDTETAHGGVAVELDASGSGTVPVTATRATTWDVLAGVTSSRTTTWDTAAQVAATRSTTWDTRTETTTTRAATWDVLAPLTATRAASWDTRALATADRSTTWNVLSSLVSVTATRAATWRTLASTLATRAATWDVRTIVSSERATSWNVRAVVATSGATTWRTLGAVARIAAATWRTLARVETSRATTWNVLSDVVVVTPPERIVYVLRESRVAASSGERRTIHSQPEPRVARVSADRRIAHTDPEP